MDQTYLEWQKDFQSGKKIDEAQERLYGSKKLNEHTLRRFWNDKSAAISRLQCG